MPRPLAPALVDSSPIRPNLATEPSEGSVVAEFLWRGRFIPEPYEPLAGEVELGLKGPDLGRVRAGYRGARAL